MTKRKLNSSHFPPENQSSAYSSEESHQSALQQSALDHLFAFIQTLLGTSPIILYLRSGSTPIPCGFKAHIPFKVKRGETYRIRQVSPLFLIELAPEIPLSYFASKIGNPAIPTMSEWRFNSAAAVIHCNTEMAELKYNLSVSTLPRQSFIATHRDLANTILKSFNSAAAVIHCNSGSVESR